METLKSNQGDDLDVEGHDPITSSNSIGDAEKLNEDTCVATDEETKLKNETEQKKEKKKDPFWINMFSGFIILYRGWKTYIKYDEAFAGLGLAALYMTVLGFDNITVGKYKKFVLLLFICKKISHWMPNGCQEFI
jgi:hypothetical protein